jgi:Bacterial capsule synthesis protein PGA_cap
MRWIFLGVLLVLSTGCGPLATVVDEGTTEPVTVTFGGEGTVGSPGLLGGSELIVTAADKEMPGVDVAVSPRTVGRTPTAWGSSPRKLKFRDHTLALFGGSPEDGMSALSGGVSKAADNHEWVLVYLRSSSQDGTCPSVLLRNAVKQLLDAGADVVVASGTGGVRPGGFGADTNRFVHYGLGRLDSDGGLLTMTLTSSTIRSAEWSPTNARGRLSGAAEQKNLKDWRDLRRRCEDLAIGTPETEGTRP